MAKAVFLLAVLLLPFSSLALTQDFCVADLSREDTPSGYPCKPAANVTADDFYYRGLATPGQIIPLFKLALALAFVKQFPGVNGLDISATRVDVAPGGVVPPHTHPRGTEIIFVMEGCLMVGFIAAESNKAYTKKVCKGEIFLFPTGLLHFQINVGTMTAVAINVYSSSNPGIQVNVYALFGNDMPTHIVEKITFLDKWGVKKLKGMFGGTS